MSRRSYKFIERPLADLDRYVNECHELIDSSKSYEYEYEYDEKYYFHTFFESLFNYLSRG